MDFYDRVSNSISRLQDLPERQRKAIFFTVIIISALIVGFFIVISEKNNISKIVESTKSINLPEFNIDNSNTSINDINMNALNVVSESDSSKIFEK